MNLRRIKMKFSIIMFSTLIILFGGLLLLGINFTPNSALPGKTEIIETYKTNDGLGLLYVDKVNDTFGIADVKKLGPLYWYNGGSDSNKLIYDMPFKAAGYGGTNDEFMVGVRIPPGSKIKYFSLGNHLEEADPLNDRITLEMIKQFPDRYHIKEVKGNYAFFLASGYSENTWTLRGFDDKGNIVADKLFGSYPRFILTP